VPCTVWRTIVRSPTSPNGSFEPSAAIASAKWPKNPWATPFLNRPSPSRFVIPRKTKFVVSCATMTSPRPARRALAAKCGVKIPRGVTRALLMNL